MKHSHNFYSQKIDSLPINLHLYYMSNTPQLLFLEKSEKQQLDDIKTNIIKMLVARGFINEQNQAKYIKKFIEDETNDDIHVIQLDNDSNYNTVIPNKRIYVTFFNYKIMSAAKNSPVGEFIFNFYDEYKIILANSITEKSEQTLDSYKSPYEIFEINRFKENIIENKFVPQHIVLTKEEGKNVMVTYNALHRHMPFIMDGDPIARYYACRAGDVCKIIRPSNQTAETISYRLCVAGKHVNAKN
jgi:DNA-directed RNA polymerase subunit H (RpoH/RPB5)